MRTNTIERVAARGAVIATFTLLAIAGCSGSGESESAAGSGDPLMPEPPCEAIRFERTARRPNVIVIVGDTMRADHFGVYGGSASTPVFDTFAEGNLYFDRAFSQAPWTKPSVATLFTSLFPSQHGLTSHTQLRARARRGPGDLMPLVDVLAESQITLAELMASNGYRTAAIVSNPWMLEKFGFAQGFEHYDDSFAAWDAPGEAVNHRGLDWLDGLGPDEPFFLYLHYMDAHLPYGRLNDADVEAIEADLRADRRPVPSQGQKFYTAMIKDGQNDFSLATEHMLENIGPTLTFLEFAYRRGIEDFDRTLGDFLLRFSEHPAYENTAIIVTSDHGEALFDRGHGNHGRTLFHDEVGVPFAARLPGASVDPARVDCAISIIDVVPSLCAYLGISCPNEMHGQSVVADDTRSREPRYVVSEGVMFKPQNRALRNRSYTFIWEPQGRLNDPRARQSLFDLQADRLEQADLISPGLAADAESRRIAAALAGELAHAIPDYRAAQTEPVELDRETLERLRSLGYVE